MTALRDTWGRVRWWIVWTLFFSTVTNYISRQTFSVLAPLITAQYHLSHTDLARSSLVPFRSRMPSPKNAGGTCWWAAFCRRREERAKGNRR